MTEVICFDLFQGNFPSFCDDFGGDHPSRLQSLKTRELGMAKAMFFAHIYGNCNALDINKFSLSKSLRL